jgi:sugar lactone lactonase YvrE
MQGRGDLAPARRDVVRWRAMRPSAAAAVASLVSACPPPPADPPAAPEGLRDAYDLEGDELFPEGMAFHPGERAFFFGSLTAGVVRRLEADGTQGTAFDVGEEGWVTLGMRVHPDGPLVVCALHGFGSDAQSAQIWLLDPETGERTRTVDLEPLQEGSGCNDVGFDSDGRVYVTDRENPNLYRLELDGTPELWRTDPELDSAVLGLNGVDLSPDGDAMLVTRYLPAALVRVPFDLGQPITRVELDGDGFGALPNGADGMLRVDDEVLVAGHTRVLRFSSEDGWATATGIGTSPPEHVAALTIAEGTLYGLKGEVTNFVLGTEPELPFRIMALGLN